MFNNKIAVMSLSPNPTYFRHAAFTGLIGLLMASCGSYQQASYYDNDGIYSSGSEYGVATRQQQAPRRQAETQKSDFYENYFGERAQELGQVLDSEVFTDIDSYTSTDSLGVARDSLLGDPNDYLAYENDYQGYGGWGDRGGNVTVNVWGSNYGWGGWYAPGYYNNWYGGWYDGWYNPWGWNNWGWGWNRPWGWNNWGWNNWGWGWNSWYGYGYAYGYPYYGWGYPSYGYRNYAYGYNSGRRGYYTRNPQNLQGSRYAATTANTSRYRTNSGRSNLGSTNRYSLGSNDRYASSRTARTRVNADAAARNQAYRSSRTTRTPSYYDGAGRTTQRYTSPARSGSNGRTYSGGSTYGQAPGSYRSSGSTPARTYRNYSSGSPSRSSGGTYRSSGGSSRSSGGSYRSSGSSSRSSGGSFRSSGGSSRSSGGSFSSGGGGSRSSGGGGGSRSSGGGGSRSGGRSN